MSKKLSQIRIIHLSDIHFGPEHRFRLPLTPAGTPPQQQGMPTLIQTLQRDWKSPEAKTPVIAAITGDLTESAAREEFAEAAEFVSNIVGSSAFGEPLTDRFFMTPGNHDVVFSQRVKQRRWRPYCSFLQNSLGKAVASETPEQLTKVHNRSADLGAVIAEINSCVYVRRDSPDEKRGQVDIQQLEQLRRQLKRIPKRVLRSSIRIAMVHHHPILLPVFAEPGSGYDSIINADSLLNILQEYGFHMVLHGHKHYPQVFSYDAECGWISTKDNPIVIVAGGSAASKQLPPSEQNACNTYNVIDVTWNPRANESRVRVNTRFLRTHNTRGQSLLPTQWKWKHLRTVDRILPSRVSGPPLGTTRTTPFTRSRGRASERARGDWYRRLRGNMPVVEVLPSFEPKQEYEAHVSIVPHESKGCPREIPEEVIWSAGPKFRNMCACQHHNNKCFASVFSYWGPMLVQARLRFKDGTTEAGYVYARLPGKS